MRLRPSWMIATAMFAAIVLPPEARIETSYAPGGGATRPADRMATPSARPWRPNG